MLLLQQVNAVSRTRFQLGSNTETHNEQSTRERANGRSSCTYFMNNPKISLLALANRNAKAGVNPTPALIETTANPKRCGFPVSRKKSGTIRPVRQHKLASKRG